MTDLSEQGFFDACEREELHRIQAIQPFGALAGGTAGDPLVRHVSANLSDWIGQAAAAWLGQPLPALLGGFPPPRETPAHGEATTADNWMRPLAEPRIYRALLDGPRGTLDAVLTCNERNWLLELEATLPEQLRHEAYRPVSHRLYRMPHSEREWRAHCQYLVDELRAATGFERVMLYRFRDDGCGEVIGESLAAGLPPYLGLRYPASDIPQIARAIYLANRHRQIPDIGAPPVPLLALAGDVADLTLAGLRAVSPVHLQYLANMGVTASLSFSLVVAGRLWGLIACHHSSARCLPVPVRERCAEMAQVFTLAIAGYRNQCRLDAVSGSDREIANLINSLRRVRGSATGADLYALGTGLDDPDELARTLEATPEPLSGPSLGRALLSLVDAEGAALVEGDELITFGVTPSAPQIRDQADWIRAREGESLIVTDALARAFPPAASCTHCASGLLAVRVGYFDTGGARRERMFLWWRPEQPQDVYWAGDPRKSALFDEQSQTLSPRSSFERWVETTSGHAEPWTDADLLRAKKFRGLVLSDINADLLRRDPF